MSKRTAAKKLSTMAKKMEAMCDNLRDLSYAEGKDSEGFDVVFTKDLWERANRLRYELESSARGLVAVEEKAPQRDVYEVLEEQNAKALRG